MGLLLFGLFLGPLGLGHSAASGGLPQSAMAATDHGTSTDIDFGAPVAQCVAGVCGPFSSAPASPLARDVRARTGRPDNDRLVRPPCLEREPPVPKISLS